MALEKNITIMGIRDIEKIGPIKTPNEDKILNHAKEILKDCEEKNYTNSEVTRLVEKLDQIRKEAVGKEKFQTRNFEGFYWC